MGCSCGVVYSIHICTHVYTYTYAYFAHECLSTVYCVEYMVIVCVVLCMYIRTHKNRFVLYKLIVLWTHVHIQLYNSIVQYKYIMCVCYSVLEGNIIFNPPQLEGFF